MNIPSSLTAPKRPGLRATGILQRFCPHIENLRTFVAKDMPIHVLQAQCYPTSLFAFCKRGEGEF
jgi:hypothetical protein